MTALVASTATGLAHEGELTMTRMTTDQIVTALIGALLLEGVDPAAIERAVTRVSECRLGRTLPGHANPMIRAFANEQSRLMIR